MITDIEAHKNQLNAKANEYIDRVADLDGGEEIADCQPAPKTDSFTVLCGICTEGVYSTVKVVEDVPLKKDAICDACAASPEQKEAIKAAEEQAIQDEEIALRDALIAKYPLT